MSLTCHRQLVMSYEDATRILARMSATGHACRAHGIWRRHNACINGQHYTAANHHPTNQVSAWQAERGSRPTRWHPRKDPREDVGFVSENVTRILVRKLLSWNLSFSQLSSLCAVENGREPWPLWISGIVFYRSHVYHITQSVNSVKAL